MTIEHNPAKVFRARIKDLEIHQDEYIKAAAIARADNNWLDTKFFTSRFHEVGEELEKTQMKSGISSDGRKPTAKKNGWIPF